MNTSPQTLTRTIVCLTAVVLTGLGSGSAASAKPDPGLPVTVYDEPRAAERCLLTRTGEQYLRCDHLTGADVAAPAWIPER